MARVFVTVATVALVTVFLWTKASDAAEVLGSNIVLNGCFSDPFCKGSFCNAVPAPEYLNKPTNTGWQVTNNNVEPLGKFWGDLPFPSNCQCQGSVDMNGSGVMGTIQQEVPIVDGNNYALFLEVQFYTCSLKGHDGKGMYCEKQNGMCTFFTYNGANLCCFFLSPSQCYKIQCNANLNPNAEKKMEIYLCGNLVATVTYPAGGTGWRNYSAVIIGASTATGSCDLVFKSISSGSGGVAPSNVQLVPIGSATTNTYPMIKIPGACPSPAPTPAPTQGDYILKDKRRRCQEAGILVVDSVWTSYPPAPDGPAGTGAGLPDAYDCWYYCR
jgi:hypothetical protein